MSWSIVIDTLFRMHDAHGHLSTIRTFDRVLRIIDRRHRSRATSRDISLDDADRALDLFQRAQTTRTLRRTRGVARHFANLARSYPQIPTSQRSEAYSEMIIAFQEYDLDSRQLWQARERFARILDEYNVTLGNECDRISNHDSRLYRMRRYYLDLTLRNKHIASVYLNQCDNIVFRRELSISSDSVRTELFLASCTFEEISNNCAQIRSKIDTARNTLDRYKRALEEAIRENRTYQRAASNRYEPTRRDQQAISRMA